MTINMNDWKNISPGEDDAAGRAYSRTSLVFGQDPFVQMLSKNVIDGLLVALFSPGALATDDGWHGLRVTNPDEVFPKVAEVFATSPLMLVNDQFIVHVSGLVGRALFPETTRVTVSA